MARSRQHAHKWIIRVAALLLAGVLALTALILLLPGWIESRVMQELRSSGVAVEALPVESVGVTSSRFGPSRLHLDRQSLEWEKLVVTYSPVSLLDGEVKAVFVDEPLLELQLAPFSPLRVRPELPPAGTPPAGSDLEEESEVTTVEEAPAKKKESKTETGEKTPPERIDAEAVVETGPAPPTPRDLHDIIAGLPFSRFASRNGRLRVQLGGESLLNLSLESRLENEAERFSGDLFLEGKGLEAMSTLRALKKERVLTLQTSAHVDPARILENLLRARSRMGSPMALPVFKFREPLKVNILAELSGSDTLKASGEASLNGAEIELPEIRRFLEIDQGLLVGTYRDGVFGVDAALKLRDFSFEDFSISGFGLRLTSGERAGFKLESDVLTFNYKDWQGSGALRGGVSGLGAPQGMHARLEFSFDTITGEAFSVQPASILLESGPEGPRLQASPIGLKRATTIWIEELQAEKDASSSETETAFKWYNGLGARMGAVRVATRTTEAMEMRIRMEDVDGKSFFSGIYHNEAEILQVRASGSLPTTWINAFGRWHGGMTAALQGNSPNFSLDLQGRRHFLKGSLDVSLDGLAITLLDGKVFRGIQADWHFLFNGLPRSEGTQELKVGSIEAGAVVVSDISMLWSLPTFRFLRVEQATGKLGGGKVWLDPFSLDPLDPAVETRMRFEGIEGDAFLQWLGEERFSIEGRVSGSLQVRWEDETLYLGDGSLKMDTGSQVSRFVFIDKAFLQEQFAAMQGVPADLREPFLQTLLEKGIRIDELSLVLIPLRETHEVSLRLEVTGETKSDAIEVPIKGFVINNVISEEDLGHLLGLVGPVRFLSEP